jgi:branched-chain amino acid transport system permease protein
MSGGVLLQAVVSGLAVGAVYALIGIGFTLVWSLTRVLALAHGDVVVTAVLVGVLVVVGRTPVAVDLSATTSVVLTVLVLAAGVVLSVVVYWATVRPFLDRSRHHSDDVVGWVAGGVTAGLVLRTALLLALPAAAYAVPDPLHLDAFTTTGSFDLPGGGTVAVRTLPVVAIALLVAVVVDRLVVATSAGRAIRAVADDVDAAALCGVSVERAVVTAFGVAGLLAAAAGLLAAPAGTLSVDDGVLLGLAGAAAALLGRLGSARGALVGGLVLGVVQQLVAVSDLLGAAWAPLVPLVVLIAVVAVRPGGLRAGRQAAVE